MRLVTITEATVLVELLPSECFLLARGLAEAGADESGHSDPARGAQGIAMQAAAGMLEGAGMAATAWLELTGEGLDAHYDLARLRGHWEQHRAPAAD